MLQDTREEWEREFDRLFIEENVWEGEDKYTKNVGVGNIKDFIRSTLAAKKEAWRSRLEAMKKVGLTTRIRGDDDFESTCCEECGDYDDCDCSGYNQAIDEIIRIIKEKNTGK